MQQRIRVLRDRLSASYWFIPMLMSLGAFVLALVTNTIDARYGRAIAGITGDLHIDSPDGARAVLSTIASSMITVAGVVFSLTMVALTLTSQQYGPLILINFMRDQGNQTVLGVFTATFIYCLLILRTIEGVGVSVFVPHLSVLVGFGLALISLAFLIYFIHYVSESIQSSSIIARISDQLSDGIDALFPAQVGRELPDPALGTLARSREQFLDLGVPIPAERSGYLQYIDDAALMQLACRHDLALALTRQPGAFIFRGEPLAHALPTAHADRDTIRAIAHSFYIGSRRTPAQDVELMFVQLSAIAVRALSPAINDPYTASMCIDRLTDALCALCLRQTPSIYRYDDGEHLRILAYPVGFKELLGTAFDEIRHYGHGDLMINMRLVKALATVAGCADTPAQIDALRAYVEVMYEESRENLTVESDLRRVEKLYNETRRVIAERAALVIL